MRGLTKEKRIQQKIPSREGSGFFCSLLCEDSTEWRRAKRNENGLIHPTSLTAKDEQVLCVAIQSPLPLKLVEMDNRTNTAINENAVIAMHCELWEVESNLRIARRGLSGLPTFHPVGRRMSPPLRLLFGSSTA